MSATNTDTLEVKNLPAIDTLSDTDYEVRSLDSMCVNESACRKQAFETK